MALSTQTQKVAAIINFPNDDIAPDVLCDYVARLNVYLQREADLWCWVLHSCDDAIDANGEPIPETPHIHMCARMKRTRVRLSTWLRELSDALQLNESYIHIQVMTSFDGQVAYYTHRYEPDYKFRYDVSELKSNLPTEELKAIVDNYEPPSIKEESVDGLLMIIEESSTRLEIMRKVGLTRYVVFRQVINELIQEIGWLPRKKRKKSADAGDAPNIA